LLDVEVTPRAAGQIETAAAWWAANRPAAPDAIRIDFQEAKSLLSHELVILAFWHASRGRGPSV
jgi:hypothetical protein